MEYKGTTKKIPEIASELGVAHVLEGGIQRSGNQVRINVQLIDAQTDEHLWAEIFDRDLTAENLFAIQSEISNKIAEALQATLTPQEQERVNSMPTDNLAAYEAYYRGKQLMATRRTAELEEATREFEKAVELDPNFALAWVGVADSHILFYSYADKPRADAIEIRENAVQQALALDPDLGEAWVSLATIHEDLDRDEEAETAYRKAIELSPNYATAYHWYANSFLDDVLRSRERLDLAYRAVELDPRSLIIGTFLAGELGRQGLYSRAEQRYRDLIDLSPEFPSTYYNLSELYYVGIADYASALVNARRAFEIDSGTVFPLLVQRQIFIEIGDFESAATLQEEIIDRDPDSYLVGMADLALALHNGNRAAAREAINWILPHVQDYPWIRAFWLRLGYLAIGDTQRARELHIQSTPEWLDPDTWEMTIRKNPFSACEMAWLFVQTGDAELGEQLLVQATDFLENQLPAAVEHADRFTTEVCYLLAGDTAKALDIMETQLSHGHLGYWGIWLRAPFFDPIRTEPRFLAFLEEHERLIAIQREAVEELLAQDMPGEPL
jgi:tetratricopeptide (TPR) repeat protein